MISTAKLFESATVAQIYQRQSEEEYTDNELADKDEEGQYKKIATKDGKVQDIQSVKWDNKKP